MSVRGVLDCISHDGTSFRQGSSERQFEGDTHLEMSIHVNRYREYRIGVRSGGQAAKLQRSNLSQNQVIVPLITEFMNRREKIVSLEPVIFLVFRWKVLLLKWKQ